jgi:hypothetical protein
VPAATSFELIATFGKGTIVERRGSISPTGRRPRRLASIRRLQTAPRT